MNIKLIALDLDRTTLNSESRLSPGNQAALEAAIAQGIHVVIASGRAFDSLPSDVVNLPGLEYAITSNGASVWHLPTKTCLHSTTLPPEAVRTVLEVTAEETLTYEGFIRGKAFGDINYVRNPEKFGAIPQGVLYVQKTRTLVEDIRGFLLEHIQELESMDVVVSDQAMKEKVTAMLSPHLSGVYLTSSSPQLLELSNAAAGKHSGVRFLMNRLGISPEETAAFGDGDNDADLLACVGFGVAVENASPACKAAADFITKHHDEDGIAYAIEAFLLPQ